LAKLSGESARPHFPQLAFVHAVASLSAADGLVELHEVSPRQGDRCELPAGLTYSNWSTRGHFAKNQTAVGVITKADATAVDSGSDLADTDLRYFNLKSTVSIVPLNALGAT